MSEYQYHNYLKETIKLAKSIVIKDQRSSELINIEVVRYFGADSVSNFPELYDTHRYYMNLAGERHYLCVPGTRTPILQSGDKVYTNRPMYAYSYDSEQMISFDKETLVDHPITLSVYREKGDEYKRLVNEYINNEMLINGILFPIDKQFAIEAIDGSIIGYDNRLIEESEISLIGKLNDRINVFISRWRVRAYAISDELYDVSFMAILAMQLPMMILNLRLENVHSDQTHSYLIKEYLNSHGKLDYYASYLTKKQLMWLYRNIEWVYKHIGMDSTLEKLVDVLLTDVGIPVYEYEMRHDVNTPDPAGLPTPIFRRFAYNSVAGNVRDYESFNGMHAYELDLNRDNRSFLKGERDNILDLLRRSNSDSLKTKILSIEDDKRLHANDIEKVSFSVANWGYEVLTEAYRDNVHFTDPLTGKSYNVSCKEAYVYMVCETLKVFGYEVRYIPYFYFPKIPLTTLLTQAQLYSKTDRSILSNIADNMLRYRDDSLSNEISLVKRAALMDKPAFIEYITKSIDSINNQVRYLGVTTSDKLRAELKCVFAMHYSEEIVQSDCSGEIYENWLMNAGLPSLKRNMEQLIDLVTILCEGATGISPVADRDIRSRRKMLLELLRTLVSYSVQILGSGITPIDVNATFTAHGYDKTTDISNASYVDKNVFTVSSMQDITVMTCVEEGEYPNIEEVWYPSGYSQDINYSVISVPNPGYDVYSQTQLSQLR